VRIDLPVLTTACTASGGYVCPRLAQTVDNTFTTMMSKGVVYPLSLSPIGGRGGYPAKSAVGQSEKWGSDYVVNEVYLVNVKSKPSHTPYNRFKAVGLRGVSVKLF
jgi:hypothetical protein